MMTVGAARKRINAIRQYSSLGAGFRIAMRDLEIRGAGSILGTAQSGHIMAVGFDLYCQLLKQAVAQLKGEKLKPRVEAEMRHSISWPRMRTHTCEPGPTRLCRHSFHRITFPRHRFGYRRIASSLKSTPPQSWLGSSANGEIVSGNFRSRLTIFSSSPKSSFPRPGLVSAGSRCAKEN